MTRFLDLADLLDLVERTGVGPVRDAGLLEAAAQRPRTSVFGEDTYPSIDEKAAALLESLVRNHPLVDGNERLGWVAVVVFYGLNSITLHAPFDPAYDLVIGVAIGDIPRPEAATTLHGWTA